MSAAGAPPRDAAARGRDSAAAERRDVTAPFHRGPTRRTP